MGTYKILYHGRDKYTTLFQLVQVSPGRTRVLHTGTRVACRKRFKEITGQLWFYYQASLSFKPYRSHQDLP